MYRALSGIPRKKTVIEAPLVMEMKAVLGEESQDFGWSRVGLSRRRRDGF
jgi:hypothetical protein